MTKTEIRLRRAALELLHSVGSVGMPIDIFQAFISDEIPGVTLSDQEAEDLLASLKEDGYVRSYTNPILKQVRWIITGTGEGARAAMAGS